MKNLVFIAYISLTLYFLIHNIISYKNKSIIFTVNKADVSVIKDNYYNLQLGFSIFNCILLILITVFICSKIDIPLFVVLYIVIYWSLNYLLKFVAIKKGYLNVNYK